MRHVVWSSSILLPRIIKIFLGVFNLQSGHESNGLSLSNITKGDNAKSKKGRAVILVCSMRLVLFYISAKYHQNIAKGIPVTDQTRNLFQTKQKGENSNRKKASCHSCTRHVVRSCSTFLPSILKIFNGSLTYRVDIKSMAYHCKI